MNRDRHEVGLKKSRSGSDRLRNQTEHIILPTIERKNLIVDTISDLLNITLLICFQDSSATLCSDLINSETSAVGCRIVAHSVTESEVEGGRSSLPPMNIVCPKSGGSGENRGQFNKWSLMP